uniref:G1 family long form salivary protein 3 n=1 Tax=Anopheles funestus TaxID=62324 RepID=Q06DI5_ANOFN|nr:G1 family long form salivary protein 3 [Anopheles funestus]
MVNDQKSLLEAAWKYGAQLQRELMLTSMESDHMQRALLLHSMMVNSSLQDMMQESYRYHGGNSRMVARMLKFVRLLPSADERVEVYKQLAGLLKSNKQDELYPAIILSSDVKELKDRSTPDLAQFESKVVERWQAQLLAGNFNEALMFAQSYPDYYAHVEKALYEALQQQWSVEALNRMVHLPNALPVATQRVTAFRAILDALLANQTKQRNDAYLMRLAHELTKLEGSLDTDETRQALEEAKKLFGQFTYTRDFSTYAELYKVFRAAF